MGSLNAAGTIQYIIWSRNTLSRKEGETPLSTQYSMHEGPVKCKFEHILQVTVVLYGHPCPEHAPSMLIPPKPCVLTYCSRLEMNAAGKHTEELVSLPIPIVMKSVLTHV